jgi:hypothetical protein
MPVRISRATKESHFQAHDRKNAVRRGRIAMRVRVFLSVSVLLGTTRAALATSILTENFDEPGGFFGGGGTNGVPSDPPAGWFVINNTDPAGSNSWFDGPQNFHSSLGAQSGSHYAGVDAASGGSFDPQTLSNWLITPQISFNAGDQVSFYTRTVNTPNFPDRLQLRLSTSGSSTDVGSTPDSTGAFSTLLVDVNPNYQLSGTGSYPTTWTQFTVSFPTSGSGRLAFRYFVENGGPGGLNSDYIGVDTLSVVGNSTVSQWSAASGGSWSTAGNWSGNTVPGGPAAKVQFSSTGLTAPATITLDGNRTVGQLTFDSAITHTIANGSAGSSLTVDDTGDSAGVNPLIAVNQGSHVISADLSLTSAGLTISTAAGSSLSLAGNVSGGTSAVSIAAGSTVQFGGNASSAPLTRTLSALTLAHGASVTAQISQSWSNPAVLNAGALTLTDSTSTLDLGNNELLTTSSLSMIQSDLRNHEIMTTAPGDAVGYAQMGGGGGGGSIELRATLLGDSDLDGRVNVADLANLAGNFGVTTGATWINGDFDYNTNVNVADLADLAGNFGGSLTATPTPSSATAVPEPAALATSLLVLAIAPALRPRRRRGQASR